MLLWLIIVLALGVPILLIGVFTGVFGEAVRTTKGNYRRLFLLAVGLGSLAFGFKACSMAMPHFCMNC